MSPEDKQVEGVVPDDRSGHGAVQRIALEEQVPRDLIEEVSRKLAYASEHVRSTQLSDDGTYVEVVLDDTGPLETVVGQVRGLVGALIRGYREIEKPILWSSAAEPAYRAPIWEDLQARGMMASSGPGCVALLGDANRVFEALDRRFADIAHGRFHAVDHRYPTMISNAALERCDYFGSFAHHLTFAGHLREDLDGIVSVATAQSSARSRAIGDALSPPAHLLSPAICFHTYRWLADQAISAPVVVTAIGRCFRWESSNFATCERLWDFTMREIVFVGGTEWVQARREEALDAVENLVEQLALAAWIEPANDPFFVGSFAAKRYFQLLTQAKFELRLRLPYAETSLAAASFNVHHDFFGRSFGVRMGDGFASTGCVGFGVERWVWALLAQHGPDIAGWPARVRAALDL